MPRPFDLTLLQAKAIEAERLQRRVDELQETLKIVAAKSEVYRTDGDFWLDEFLKRTKEKSNAETV
jgi:hypothetical protein